MNDQARPDRTSSRQNIYADIAARLRAQGFVKASVETVKAAHVRLVLQGLRGPNKARVSEPEDD